VKEELGVRPVINCSGNLTVLGGNVVDEAVIDAMKEAARSFFDMPELHLKAGEYIAKLIGVEDAYIVNGGEAGIVLSLAACMTRGDIDKMVTLPNSQGMKHEVIVQSLHRNMYDYPLEFTGSRIVEAGDKNGTTREDFKRSISDQTVASVYFVYDPQERVLPLQEVAGICHERNIPVIADAAAELPPKENLTKFLKLGADLVVFSGGKDIGAPNDTGLVLGRKDLVSTCRSLGPHSYLPYRTGTHVFIGRPMKTSKEDVFAFVTAFKKYLVSDEKARLLEWERKADYLVGELSKYSNAGNVKKMYDGPGQPRPSCVPKVELELHTDKGISAAEIMDKLKDDEPSILTYVRGGKLYLNTQCIQPDEEKIVVQRLANILRNM
jgi:L-seryl-tRNA(Ser) seleniumtransferase